MSAIRPDLTAPTPQAAAPVRNAQAAFFRAALGQATAAAAATAVQTTVTASTSTARESAEPTRSTRSTRPGSLLDIRV